MSNDIGGEGKIDLPELDAPVHGLLHDGGNLLVAGARGDDESGIVAEEAREQLPVTRPTGELEASVRTVHRAHPRAKALNPARPGSGKTGLSEGVNLGDARGGFAPDDGPVLTLVGDPHDPSEALGPSVARPLLSVTTNELMPSRA